MLFEITSRRMVTTSHQDVSFGSKEVQENLGIPLGMPLSGASLAGCGQGGGTVSTERCIPLGCRMQMAARCFGMRLCARLSALMNYLNRFVGRCPTLVCGGLSALQECGHPCPHRALIRLADKDVRTPVDNGLSVFGGGL